MWKSYTADVELFYRIALQFIEEMKKDCKVEFDTDYIDCDRFGSRLRGDELEMCIELPVKFNGFEVSCILSLDYRKLCRIQKDNRIQDENGVLKLI